MGQLNEALDFADFFENSAVPMHCVSPDGTILRANQAELDLLGYKADEYVGRSIRDVYADRRDIEDILARLSGGEKLVKYPATLKAKDGSLRHVLISSSGYFREGKLVHTRCVTLDVTAERAADLVREQERSELEQVINKTPFMLVRYGSDMRYRFASNSFAQMLNLQPDEIIGKRMPEVIGKDAFASLLPHITKVLAGEPVEFVTEIPYPGTSGRCYQVVYAPERNSEGTVTGWTASLLDITEREQAQKRNAADLRAATLLRDIGMLCLHDGIDVHECLFAILDAAIEITGAAKGNIQLIDGDVLKIAVQRGFDLPFLEFFAAVHDQSSACGAAMRGGRVVVEDVLKSQIFAGQASLDVLLAAGVRAVQSTPLVSSSGRLLGMISTHFGQPGRPEEHQLHLVDILARQGADYLERRQADRSARRAEEALRQSELRWRTMTETLPNLVWTDLPDGQCDWLSSQWGEYTGIPVPELLGLNWLDRVIHPDDRERTRAAWENACADRADYDLEYRIRRHDGAYRWFKTRGVPIRDDSGKITYWFGTCTDIEDIRQAEQRERALIESNLAATAKFEAVFNQSGIIAAITSADGTLLEINDLAVKLCGYSREQVVQKPFWETPWWRGSEDVRLSIRQAVREASQGRVFQEELRYWSVDGTERIATFAMHPIRDQNGTVRFLHATGFDISERKLMENALRDSEATFRAMFSISSVGKAQADAYSGKFVRVNTALSALTGYDESELLQRGFVDITHPDDWIRDCDGIRRLVSGEADKFDAETRYICKDGSTRWVRATLNLISNRGRPLRTTAVIQDISDRKNAEEQADVLLREVNHRAKNMLSVVLAIARHTANDDGGGLSARFEDRVRALAASQDVLVASGWKNVPISVLIRAQLAHFGDLLDSRILLSGPDLNITAQAAQTIGMALHELATNAAKYGALSNDKGRIEIAWHVRADSSGTERFGICWKESGGPQVVAPTRRGFGSTVLERVAKMSLRAEASVDYAATGLNWQLECPSTQLLAGATSTTLVGATDVPRRDSDKIRILLVEDEILPALEIAAGLTDAGFEVLGPAGSVEEALLLLEQGCDAAILDVNLGPVTSERVALLLGARGTPFVTISGYTRGQLPAAYKDTPLLTKPIRQDLLVSALKRCIGLESEDERQHHVSVEKDLPSAADLLPLAASAPSTAARQIPG